MDTGRRAGRGWWGVCRVFWVAAVCLLLPGTASSQELSGTLVGTVKDAKGGVLPRAEVTVSSPALPSGSLMRVTSETGQFRFLGLPPGAYVLDVRFQTLAPFRERGLIIDGLGTLERTIELQLPGVAESVVVEGLGSRIEARESGLIARFRRDDLDRIPTRRASMFDWIRAAPGILPTSPSGASGTATTVSAFGSGVNDNQFLIDGTNTTCPCNGVARSEPGTDFIESVQVQSIGASAEFGNLQGAVISVITRQGGDLFDASASYFHQSDDLTSHPVLLTIPGTERETGYTRRRFRDFTPTIGGPIVRQRLWFFGAYQYLRDYDSQPGTDPDTPRRYEQNKVFGKLTWRLAPTWQLVQSVHYEDWINPEQPTVARPYVATLLTQARVPSISFGQLTHTVGTNTVWEARAGRFRFDQTMPPATGDTTTASRLDLPSNRISLAPQQFSNLSLVRTTAKATVTRYGTRLLGLDHQIKTGVQFERGEHESLLVIPTGTRYVYSNSQPSQSISMLPSNTGGRAVNVAAFLNDSATFRNRLTVNAGVRFDHSRAISPDLHGVDLAGETVADIIKGRGRLYTWNVWSPRFGVTMKITGDGRTMLRASAGRFHQGVLTGELGVLHPGATAVTTRAYVAADNAYTGRTTVVDPAVNLQFDPRTRSPRTDEYSLAADRELGGNLAVGAAYVYKTGRDFIGWTDTAGIYEATPRTLADGREVSLWQLTNAPNARRFLLANVNDYSLEYRGVVVTAEKRRAGSWQLAGSYTFSKTTGLLPSSGTTAGGAQASTVAPPPAPGLTFGRDPNDLTNAGGRLPNDRPHVLRLTGSVDIPRTGILVAASFGHWSGKPWAAITQVNAAQNMQQRIQLEPRGTRRLSSQSLLDLRVAKPIVSGSRARIELLVDVLNLLNDHAEEGLVSEILTTETIRENPDFGRPSAFIDPRRAMVGLRVNFGR